MYTKHGAGSVMWMETGLGNFGCIFIHIFPLLLYKRRHTCVLKAAGGGESPLIKCIISSLINIVRAVSLCFSKL